MSSTSSLRNDHQLIEKMLQALKVISELLKKEKKIPSQILDQAIDFSVNFTNFCHHGKEEESLFPTLERKGMPKEGGPIARMIYEHEITQKLTDDIISSSKSYTSTGESSPLIKSIDEYVEHVSLHLSKENLRLFQMADMILNDDRSAVYTDLEESEKTKLDKLGQSREYYEKIVDDLGSKTTTIN